MKRWQLLLTATGVLLLMSVWGLHHIGWLFASSAGELSGQSSHISNADAFDTPSGWRYRQNQPHHWRYIMLQK